MEIRLKKLEDSISLPSYATAGSAGMDLRAAISEKILLKKRERKLVPTGISMAIPCGYNGEVRPRSGLAYENGITVLNSPGTIDSDYRGELKVLLINLGEDDFWIEPQMRIAQLVIQKCEIVSWNIVEHLEDTGRSNGGYGSTGVK
ncbi:MAG: dUTP diphosphatase [Holosporaceae bacterium]|nr:dUTP diphosphatase [Holosporaceae bacterium]